MAVVPRDFGSISRRAALPLCVVCPDTGDRETTVSAGALFDVVLQNVMPGPAHQEFPALWAVRVCPIAVNVALINVVQASIERDLPRAIERRSRSPRFVLQLEIRVKPREVQRHIRSQMRQDPFRELARLRGIV